MAFRVRHVFRIGWMSTICGSSGSDGAFVGSECAGSRWFYTRAFAVSCYQEGNRPNQRTKSTGCMYIHPWELDTGQRYNKGDAARND